MDADRIPLAQLIKVVTQELRSAEDAAFLQGKEPVMEFESCELEMAFADTLTRAKTGRSGTRDLFRSREAVTSASSSFLSAHRYREVSECLPLR